MSEKNRLRDLVPSLLRTAIPSLWGTVLAHVTIFLAANLPARFADPLVELLASPKVTELLVVAAILGWYFLWRYLEPIIPDWAARIVLGSSQAPVYPDSDLVDDDDELEDDDSLDDTERWDDEPGSDDFRGERTPAVPTAVVNALLQARENVGDADEERDIIDRFLTSHGVEV